MESVRIFAPASVSNVGCGFDVMGFALEAPGDELVLSFQDNPGVSFEKITGDQGRLPLDPNLNTASVAVQKYLERVDPGKGIKMILHKKMPFGSGLGSSAASAVGAVFGANLLMGEPLSRLELVPFAMAGEEIASGSRHADNVAPAMLGGFVLVRSYDPLDLVELNYPEELWVSIIYPKVEISTKSARDMLPKKIAINDAITQWGNLGSLVAGLTRGDYDLIGRSIVDKVAEPVRQKLIPRYDRIKAAALESQAFGCGISGSGPSIFALARGEEHARRIGAAMQREHSKLGTESVIFNSPINPSGPKILEGQMGN